MPFTQNGPNVSADLGNYNDIHGNQDNMFSRTIETILHGNQNTINIFNIGSDSVAKPSAQQILKAGPSNEIPSVIPKRPLRHWQQQLIAANDMSRLIVSIGRLLANRMESLDKVFETRGSDRASVIETATLECLETLQEFFAKFQGYQEGLSVTGIPSNNAPRRFQRQELCRIKKGLEMHLVALMEFLALNSYVRYTYRKIINLS